ncbi:MAG TPA: flagellar motor protein MotB [Verrucomicrobiae bacterium]|jgi:chemotaxis protein MotB|nr:flagellar motor protein MotB [Verrucomicrobiae bacterium]
MSDSNPFTPAAPSPEEPGDGSKAGWIIALVMAAAGVFFLSLWLSSRDDHKKLDELRATLANTSTNLANTEAENKKDQEQIAALQSQIADLQKEKENVSQAAKGLENEMRSDLESKDVTISNLKGKLTVNILDRVMFDSGEAVLKPDGEAVMQKVADVLAKHPELKIHIIGHTDNIPIRSGSRGRFTSNWELSTARALAALHFLTEKAGVDPRRVGAVGYGEYRPIADNATAEGRARNRRIAITILPDELAGADTGAAARNAVSTNASPVEIPPP